MVLANLMLLPDDDMQVRSGLGVLPDLVLPHYGETRAEVVDQTRDQLLDACRSDQAAVGRPAGQLVAVAQLQLAQHR